MEHGECEVKFKTLDGLEHKFHGEFMSWDAKLVSDVRSHVPVKMLTVKMIFKEGEKGHIVVVEE